MVLEQIYKNGGIAMYMDSITERKVRVLEDRVTDIRDACQKVNDAITELQAAHYRLSVTGEVIQQGYAFKMAEMLQSDEAETLLELHLRKSKNIEQDLNTLAQRVERAIYDIQSEAGCRY
jgi:predicted Zn-dependent protease